MVALSQPILVDADQLIAGFDSAGGNQMAWRITDDGVMGGRSRGQFEYSEEGVMIFKGNLSLENNGGFSSVRTEIVRLDLSESKGLALRVKGDGRSYQMRLSTAARYRSREVSFSAEFQTRKDTWIEVRVPFSAFRAGFRGRSLKGVDFDSSSVRRIGILLGDKKPGPFRLEIDSIRAYGAAGSRSLGNLIAADKRFKTFASALPLTGLLDDLKGGGPFTVFAPTDDAFSALPKGSLEMLLSPNNRALLQSILSNHSVQGRFDVGDLLNARSATAVGGESLIFGVRKGLLQVNDATIRTANLNCSNGVIHIIDAVLLFPSLLGIASSDRTEKTATKAARDEIRLVSISRSRNALESPSIPSEKILF
ncbi:CIA30 family protein [bacterium]|nr:CIA30 family protein [bacterium]